MMQPPTIKSSICRPAKGDQLFQPEALRELFGADASWSEMTSCLRDACDKVMAPLSALDSSESRENRMSHLTQIVQALCYLTLIAEQNTIGHDSYIQLKSVLVAVVRDLSQALMLLAPAAQESCSLSVQVGMCGLAIDHCLLKLLLLEHHHGTSPQSSQRVESALKFAGTVQRYLALVRSRMAPEQVLNLKVLDQALQRAEALGRVLAYRVSGNTEQSVPHSNDTCLSIMIGQKDPEAVFGRFLGGEAGDQQASLWSWLQMLIMAITSQLCASVDPTKRSVDSTLQRLSGNAEQGLPPNVAPAGASAESYAAGIGPDTIRKQAMNSAVSMAMAWASNADQVAGTNRSQRLVDSLGPKEAKSDARTDDAGNDNLWSAMLALAASLACFAHTLKHKAAGKQRTDVAQEAGATGTTNPDDDGQCRPADKTNDLTSLGEETWATDPRTARLVRGPTLSSLLAVSSSSSIGGVSRSRPMPTKATRSLFAPATAESVSVRQSAAKSALDSIVVAQVEQKRMAVGEDNSHAGSHARQAENGQK